MKMTPAILFLLFSFLSAAGQKTIKGRVVNESTGTAVPGSSVFITGTSKGTITDNAGNFELVNVPGGKHELVISSIGYETNVFSFSEEQLPLNLKVELQIKVKELQNVIAGSSVEEGWDKWGKTFMENFVGTTDNASKCRIKNEQAIRFRYYKQTNHLVAYCDEPVILENKALGYTIKYQLENFEVNFNEHSMFYLGYSLFESWVDENKSRKEKWEEWRREAYEGSIMHFMRSLFTNSLAREGFEVRRMYRVPNNEKLRIKEWYKATRTIKKTGNNEVVLGMADWLAQFRKDSAKYYGALLHEPDYNDIYAPDILTADSLIIQSLENFKVLHYEDYLFITFKKEKEDKDYVAMQHPPHKAGFQRSFVILLNDKLISLDKSGNYYNPQDFFTSGYWSWGEKMANSLPLDYEVEK